MHVPHGFIGSTGTSAGRTDLLPAEIILDGKATTTDVSKLDPARYFGRRGRLWG